MSNHTIHVDFPGRIVFVGFGSIGQGVLPLILRHIGGVKPERITIVTADDAGQREAAQYGIKFVNNPLTRDNYKRVLEPLVGRGDFLINVSVDVSSLALIKFCWEKGALYIEPVSSRGRAANRSHDPDLAPLELRAARGSTGASAGQSARTDRGDHARSQSGTGVASREAGAAQHRPTRASRRACLPTARNGCWRKSSA
jgi:hypothetical protein